MEFMSIGRNEITGNFTQRMPPALISSKRMPLTERLRMPLVAMAALSLGAKSIFSTSSMKNLALVTFISEVLVEDFLEGFGPWVTVISSSLALNFKGLGSLEAGFSTDQSPALN